MTDLENQIATYFKDKNDVIAVYLFGSYSIGMEKPYSDLDIGILLKHQSVRKAIAQQMIFMTDLGRILRKDIHPVIMNSSGEMLLEQIFKKGKCLLINDKTEHAKFKMTAISKILDFSYLQRKMQSGFLKNLMEV